MLGLEEYMYNAFKYGDSEKMGFCGNRAMLTIQQICRKNSEFQLISGQKEYGMNVSRLTCPFGSIVLKTHPLFNQLVGGTTGGSPYYGMESWLFILNMADFVYRYIDDTKYTTDLELPGTDGKKAGFLTEAGFEIHHPTNHYLIKSLHAAAVDA
jgi:hypothetical protein